MNKEAQNFDSIGKALKYLRIKEGLTQDDMAAKMGIAKASGVSKVEADRNVPKLNTVARFVEAAGGKLFVVMVDSQGNESIVEGCNI